MDVDELTALLFNLTLSPPKPVPKNPNALRRIPPEIRAIIFKYALEVRPNSHTIITLHPPATRAAPLVPSWTAVPTVPTHVATLGCVRLFEAGSKKPRRSMWHRTPSLLAALRAAPDLYREALEVFYTTNHFALNIDTFARFKQLKVQVIQLIKFLVIDLRTTENDPKPLLKHFNRLFSYPRSPLTFLTALQRAAIKTNTEDTVLYRLMIHAAKHWIRLRALTLVMYHEDNESSSQMQAFVTAWLKMQGRTENWAHFAPRLPQRQGDQWDLAISQWMAPRDMRKGGFKFRVRRRDMPK